jgi:hypothetical protein
MRGFLHLNRGIMLGSLVFRLLMFKLDMPRRNHPGCTILHGKRMCYAVNTLKGFASNHSVSVALSICISATVTRS